MEREFEKLRKNGQFCEIKDKNPRGFIQWFDYMQKNKPQTNALVAGLMVILFGGQNIGWSIFNDHLDIQTWSGGYEDDGTVFWAITSFYLAAASGFLIGSLLVGKFSKINIYIFTTLLSATSATCFIIHPSSIYVVVPARIIAGISYGITYLTILIHACEIAVPKLRGMIVATVHFCLMIGVFTMSSSLIPVYKTRSYEVDPTKSMGLNALICLVSGMLLSLFLHKESPVYLIKKYHEEEALNTMIRLRSESHETATIRNDFNEFCMMVQEDSQSSLNLFKYSYQFAIVMIVKLVFVSSFNMLINNYMLELAKLHFYDAENDLTATILSGIRWGAMLIGMFLIDVKRMKLFFISSFGSGLILILLLFEPITDTSFGAVVVTIGFQFFSGLAIGLISDIFLVDSVNTRVKPFFIAMTNIIECSIQILLIVSYFYFKNISIMHFISIFGVIMIIGGAIAFTSILPDTTGLSLRLARNKFIQ
ncbi:hypothetical protein PVAND_007774 [Polypedilum vanderplanki]|uniref:Major facilitator superfamily (MFS) profile domain-containing protein n=1 Tax=Polypedilum vanderplanki TaxID=319348 RepID=A0A9J6C886_POLVA|nr:hypothetical protein PVAND_007774 [Polypedilum vanderplanki]